MINNLHQHHGDIRFSISDDNFEVIVNDIIAVDEAENKLSIEYDIVGPRELNQEESEVLYNNLSEFINKILLEFIESEENK